MNFEILGTLASIETIASGRGIRELKRLNRVYGKAAWRKRKGIARIRLSDGTVKLAELHWYKNKKLPGARIMKHKFLLCVENKGYEASLEIRKLYEQIPDREAERHNQVRIIDESGEDYLYPSSFFATVRLSIQTKDKLLEQCGLTTRISAPAKVSHPTGGTVIDRMMPLVSTAPVKAKLSAFIIAFIGVHPV